MFKSPREFKNRKVKLSFKEDIEPHEILLDKLAQRKEEELGISEKKFEVPLLKKILEGFLVFAFCLILILFAKTFQLQTIEAKNLSALAEENKFIFYRIQAARGVIYDRNLNQLVSNFSSFDLVCLKFDLPKEETERTKVLKEISQITKKNLTELEEKIRDCQEPIAENIDQQTLIILETKIKELPGFQIIQNPIRKYQDGQNFSHLIGFTGKIRTEELKAAPEFYSLTDYIGRDGIEKSYEEILRRNPGQIRVERDALGNVISKEIIELPESGKSLVLWLDSELQKKIIEELEKKLQELGLKKAAAVAIDPKTGGVLALVSLPKFDNNLFQKGSDPEALQKLLDDPLKLQPLFNRAISGQYLIGSTIKPLIASAALEEKTISPNKKINCQGAITIPHQYEPEKETKKEDWTVHGWTDLRKAIAESCNVYFYTVGGGYKEQEGLGPTRIKKYLELFGWGQIPKIDLPAPEWATGLVPDPEWKKKKFEGTPEQYWWDGDTYNLSIGQGYILTTPLQVATAFSAIANGGKLLEPHVVQKTVDTLAGSVQVGEEDKSSSSPFAEARVIEEIQPKIIRENFIEPENLQIVREGMRQAVTAGSATGWLDQLPVRAAAKTGTAELGNDYYHNWVTVFAPYEDPQIVLTVMIENVKEIQAATLPVAKNILEWYFTR